MPDPRLKACGDDKCAETAPLPKFEDCRKKTATRLRPVKKVGPAFPIRINLKHLNIRHPKSENVRDARGKTDHRVAGSHAHGKPHRFIFSFTKRSQENFSPAQCDIGDSPDDPVRHARCIRNVLVFSKSRRNKCKQNQNDKDRKKIISMWFHLSGNGLRNGFRIRFRDYLSLLDFFSLHRQSLQSFGESFPAMDRH